MFKRRIAVLGAVAVLVVTGLAGSAMASGEPPVPGAKMTCTTLDGKPVAVRLAETRQAGGDERALPAIPDGEARRAGVAGRTSAGVPSDDELRTLEKGGVRVMKLPDGGVAVEAVPASELPADGEAVRATAPLQATDADGKPFVVRGKDSNGKAVDVTKPKGDGILCKTVKE
jgi:hypothetical protein